MLTVISNEVRIEKSALAKYLTKKIIYKVYRTILIFFSGKTALSKYLTTVCKDIFHHIGLYWIFDLYTWIFDNIKVKFFVNIACICRWYLEEDCRQEIINAMICLLKGYAIVLSGID